MQTNKIITVLGAGRHTGRFVIDLLERKGLTARAATRTGSFTDLSGRDRLCETLDFSDAAGLDDLMRGAHAVINCAGPFLDSAKPAIEAALRAGVPYLDVTAEQTSVVETFENFDARAKDAGMAIVPAMAFYGGLADLLTSAVLQSMGADGDSAIDEIEIAVGLDSWLPTAGTRKTGDRNTYPRKIVRNGALVTVPDQPLEKDWDYGPDKSGMQRVSCITLSEVILIARHVRANAITSYMNAKPLVDLRDPKTPPPTPAGADGKSAQEFVVDVRVRKDGIVKRAMASGQDIYAVTAPLVVNACLDILDRTGPGGVFAPGMILDPNSFLAGLVPDIDVQFFD